MAISDSESFCNDGTEESWIILTGLPCLFREQFPKMPKDHIARLIFDRHRQNASGGYWRNLISRQKDTGRISWPINFKDYVKASSPVMHFPTYASNYATAVFQKQGFPREISLDKAI
ncbi:hypothetical protein PABG_02701 [Paracoccidioides brasiliensis Pb03]|nr:hypothetical protein PABG_02701 [Paracoccidioides brasiliensis Pb03]